MTEKLGNKKMWIRNCYSIYNIYNDVLDSYVLDYFTKHHWNKLPKSWQYDLQNFPVAELANLLDCNKPIRCGILPLSLLALRECLRNVCLPRKVSNIENIQKSTFMNDERLKKLFWRNVKLKKRHEISVMAKVCYQKAVETDCMYIIDIGSGLGHLSRLLNFGYGFKVCAIEAQQKLSEQAGELDAAFERILLKSEIYNGRYFKTAHLSLNIGPDITSKQFLKIVSEAFDVQDLSKFRFGIVGLHPCGDLGATLLKLYNKCQNISFINVVGCCYMKLTTTVRKNQGYPLSSFCKENNYDLSYSSLEVACHAIENYSKKLEEGEYWKLKIHAYRAAIEKLIISQNPKLCHSALASVKYTKNLTFEEYCRKALHKLGLFISKQEIYSAEVEEYLKDWSKVVIFYSLRLLLAPLVETIVLLDRLIYAEESG